MSAYTDDAYKVLGVSPDATEKEIKTAYRKLALIHHPDRQSDPKKRDLATTNFVKIANAYEVLTDEYLRAEYNERQRSTVSSSSNSNNNYNTTPTPTSTYTSNTSNNTKPSSTPRTNTRSLTVRNNNNKNGTKSNPSGNNDVHNEPFRYHFSDPYEVFKRDFREQFGIDYPGAKYDWIDFNEPMVAPAASNNNNNNNRMIESDDSSKKKGFNPFRRKQKDLLDPSSNNGQLVVKNSDKNMPLTSYNEKCTDIVLAEKRNNRPVSMDVQTSKVGTVTTTKTTITRPDGSTETMTMRTGIPGKAKPPNNTPSSPVPRLTNGPTPPKQITNGTPMKALPPSTTKTTSNNVRTNNTNQKLLTSSNNNNNNNAMVKVEPKTKSLVGWGNRSGGKQ